MTPLLRRVFSKTHVFSYLILNLFSQDFAFCQKEKSPLLSEAQVIDQNGCIIVIQSNYLLVGESWEISQSNAATGLDDILARVVVGGKDTQGFGYARLKDEVQGCRNFVGKKLQRITTVPVYTQKQIEENAAWKVTVPQKPEWPEPGFHGDATVGISWNEIKNLHYSPNHYDSGANREINTYLEIFPFSFSSIGIVAKTVGFAFRGKYAASLSESAIINDNNENQGTNTSVFWDTQYSLLLRKTQDLDTKIYQIGLSPLYRRFLKNKGSQPDVRTPYLDYTISGGWAEFNFRWKDLKGKTVWGGTAGVLLGGRGQLKYYPKFEEVYPKESPEFGTGRFNHPTLYRATLSYSNFLGKTFSFLGRLQWEQLRAEANGRNVSMKPKKVLHTNYSLVCGFGADI